MIKLENVQKEFYVKREKKNVLNNINFNFKKGKFYAIMGPSGCGKTTLLQMIGLLDKPTKGNINFENKNISNLTADEISNIRNKKIGFVFQSYFLNSHLKIYENVMLPLYINKDIPKKDRENLVFEILNNLGLKDKIFCYPSQLSGGEQQRVAIARALVNCPAVIIADEPTGNLDFENEKKIFKLFKRMSENGVCVIVSSHNSLIKNYADKTLYISNGILRECIYE